MRYPLHGIVAGVLALASTVLAQSVLDTPAGRSIKLETLKHHVYALAADSMEGRDTGSKGYEKAARYVEGVFRRIGAKTMLTDDRNRSTYRQDLQFWRAAEADSGSLEVVSVTGKVRFKQGRDFKFDTMVGPEILAQALGAVYVGYGIGRGSWDDYRGLNLKGKVAVMLSRIPEQNSGLPDSLVQLYKGSRRSNQRVEAAQAHGAVAVLRLADGWTSQYWKTFGDALMAAGLRRLADSEPGEGEAARLTVLQSVAQSLFKGQAIMPLDSTAGAPPYKGFALEGVSLRFKPGPRSGVVASPNVVGCIRGTDSALRDEYIVVGAHLDHVGRRDGEICNGADDNASGVAALLEVAEAVASRPLPRSVCFVAFTGEEKGLLGSKYFVGHSPIPMEKIAFMINLDMMGRTASSLDSSRSHLVYYSDEGDEAIKNMIERLNRGTVHWTLKMRRAGGSARSDHGSFMDRDVPVTFFYSGNHGDYHRPTDDADKIDYEKLYALSRLVYALVAETASKPGPVFPRSDH